MADRKVRFGILGCGTVADFHATGIHGCAAAELAGVFDVDPQRAKAFAQAQRVERVFSSLEELAEAEGIDAICICTPSGLHRDAVLPCLQHGKHVLVEKPLEISTQRIDEIIQFRRPSGVKIGGVFQLRFGEDVQKVKAALEQEALGKILIADAYMKHYRSPEYFAQAGWRGTWAIDGGGALMNQGIHWIDLLLWLAGEVRVVTGHCRTLARDIEVEDTGYAILQLSSGALGMIESTTCAYPGLPSRIEIHGEKGSICLEDDKIVRWEIEGQRMDLKRTESEERGYADPKAISTRGHILQIEDFVDAILKDRPPAVDLFEARRSVACIEAIYESSRKNAPVEIQPYRGGR